MSEVILKKNIKNLGEKNSVVKVKDGYANYLIAKDMAIAGTQANKNRLAECLRQSEQKEAKRRQEALELGKKLDSIQLIFSERVDESGKLFAMLTPSKIAEAYKTHNITIDPKQITIVNTPIKETGMHEAKLVLHKTLEKTIYLDVRSTT